MVRPGQARTNRPASTVTTPKASTQTQCRPTPARTSAGSARSCRFIGSPSKLKPITQRRAIPSGPDLVVGGGGGLLFLQLRLGDGDREAKGACDLAARRHNPGGADDRGDP